MSRSAVSTSAVLVALLVGAAAIVAGVAVFRMDVTGRNGSGLPDEFDYDLRKLGRVDPDLILYDEMPQSIDTGFAKTRAVSAGPDDRVYVAGDNAIRIFKSSGVLVDDMDLPATPTALTVTADGKIYVGLGDHVEVYDSSGNRFATWPSLGEKAAVTSIAVNGSEAFVADAGNRLVHRCDTSGKVINRIGQKDPRRGIEGFVIPSLNPCFDLALGSDGLLRVANHGRRRIEAYTPGGDLEFFWGKQSMRIEDFCGCCNPMNFAIMADGSFVTVEKGLTRVKIYDPQGKFVGVVAGPEQLVGLGSAYICKTVEDCRKGNFDVAVDSTGRILVLDTRRNQVRIFIKKKASS